MAGVDDEVSAVAAGIADRIAEGVPPSSMAVLVDDPVVRELVRSELEANGCRVEDFRKGKGERQINIFDQSVKLLTIASAKGIEFQVVYVPAVTEENFPATDEDGETADRARRALYTAMTRCTWELHLSAPDARRSDLLFELDDSRVVYHHHLDSGATPEDKGGTHSIGGQMRSGSLADRMTSDGSSTVGAIVSRLFGLRVVGGPPRFRDEGWSYEGECAADCPACGTTLQVLRKPFTTPSGKLYRYWALVCTRCGVARELNSLDGHRQRLVRQG